MSKTYISYGHKFYDPKKFDPIRNRKNNCWINKPAGGLWAADVRSDDWQVFCIDNSYMRHRYNKANSFKFKISEKARILKLYTDNDCNEVVRKYKLKKLDGRQRPNIFNKYVLDFEKLAEDFDVIDYKDYECQSTFPFWDIDCILVLNQDVIRPL